MSRGEPLTTSRVLIRASSRMSGLPVDHQGLAETDTGDNPDPDSPQTGRCCPSGYVASRGLQ